VRIATAPKIRIPDGARYGIIPAMNTAVPRLGVDIGRVIIDGPHHPGGGDTAFFQGDTAAMLATPAVEGAFDALTRLTVRFSGNVWLVSKCGERIERRSLAWLTHHRFPERTGIPLGHVRFCRARAQKAIHCAELGITHFVDDRAEVHAALDGVVAHRYQFGSSSAPDGIVPVPTWADAELAILATLRKE
jgi:hypothetical protein